MSISNLSFYTPRPSLKDTRTELVLKYVYTGTVQYLANCEGFIPLDPKVANDDRNLIDTENSCPIC